MAVRVGAQIHPQQASYARMRGSGSKEIERSIKLISWRDDYHDRHPEAAAS